MVHPITDNTLFYGDNLTILREYFADESVDLIYLDPPFNSNRSYNILFRETGGKESDAQITAFDDTWHWGPSSAQMLLELPNHASPRVVKMVNALVDGLGHNDVTAYLVMMAARLVELHRVLKPTGSLYLHCDPTASHYLKIVLDSIFVPENFRNEIVWQRTISHNIRTKRYVRVNDTILFYSKTTWFTFNHQYTEYGPRQMGRYKQDATGRWYKAENLTFSSPNPDRQFEWRGAKLPPNRSWGAAVEQLEEWYSQGRILLKKDGMTPRLDGLKIYLDETKGKPISTNWTDIPRVGNTSAERLGYPTQKPLALLERIIQASSNPGDLVLDPFCGCGTAIHAAQKLGRRWVGIDITHLAIALIKNRLEDAYPGIQYRVVGEPVSLYDAQQLAVQNRYQFEWWALSLVKARPARNRKKGADEGIDGFIFFNDDPNNQSIKTCVVQVKSGRVDVRTVRELAAVLEREKVAIGLLITLNEPTQPMEAEAIGAGLYTSPIGTSYPRIQILTVAQLLKGVQPKYPYGTAITFKQAPREAPGKTIRMFD